MTKTYNSYKTIGEVVKILNLKSKKSYSKATHTIRFWESEFKQIKPIILNGNRRYYDEKNIKLLKKVHYVITLFNKDKQSIYFTENNGDFLEETCIDKHMSYNDEYLRPPMVVKRDYDIMSGSINTTTPLRYDLNFRNFYQVTEGKIALKLVPPKYGKYLKIKKDVSHNVLMIHGDADEIVSPNFLLEAKDYLMRNNVNIETHLLKNCGHHIPIEASSIALNYIQKKI